MVLIGNKVTEKDIRDWLDENGYIGRTAEIKDLELHAIQRPGWLQIYRFELAVLKHEESDTGIQARHQYYGVVRDDERERNSKARTVVTLFDQEQQRQQKLDDLSEGLIQLGRNNSGSLLWLMVIFGSMFLLALLANQFVAR